MSGDWVQSPGEGNGNPFQYSCLENSMGRGARWATVHRVANSQTRPSNYTHTQLTGRGQHTNIIRNLEEIDSNPQGWLWGVQDFNEGSNCRCGRKASVSEWKSLSSVWLFETPWTIQPWNSPGQNIGVGSLSLLQGIFPTQGLNPGLPHCRRILCQLSFQGKASEAELKGSLKKWLNCCNLMLNFHGRGAAAYEWTKTVVCS